jgi:hypothetical protein
MEYDFTGLVSRRTRISFDGVTGGSGLLFTGTMGDADPIFKMNNGGWIDMGLL